MPGYLDQVQRDREKYLSRHDTFFVVRQLFYIGPPIRRWAEDHTVVETASLDDVVDSFPGLDGPEAVIKVDLRAGTSADVSKEAAEIVARRVRSGDMVLTDDLRNFIEDHCGVGTLIPAAA